MYKFFVVSALLAITSAAPGATSYSSYNDNHSAVQHIESAPIAKYDAPVYAAPSYATPAYATLPRAPVVTKVAVAPVAKYVATPAYKEEEYGPAQYEFAYAIADPHTGDYHSQEEKRNGDHVVGQYSLHEADGSIRIVKYSDEGHGFNAVVEKQGNPIEAPVAYKKVVAVAAPQYKY